MDDVNADRTDVRRVGITLSRQERLVLRVALLQAEKEWRAKGCPTAANHAKALYDRLAERERSYARAAASTLCAR
jgi:hypothetical protein